VSPQVGPVTSAKVLVPRLPPDALERDQLRGRLDGIPLARITTVIAGIGFGKTTAVAGWAADHAAAWYTVDASDRDPRVLAAGITAALRVRIPGVVADPAVLAGGAPADDQHAAGLAAFLADSVGQLARRDLALVIDDAHELDGTPSAALLAALCRLAPPTLHLVLVSQSEAPFPIARLRAQAQVLEIGAADLALAPDETQRVLRQVMSPAGHAAPAGEGDLDRLAHTVHAATGGWPAAVRLAAAALRGRPAEHRVAAFEQLVHPGGPIAELLADEVVASLDRTELELVRAAARLDRFSVELLDAMGVAGWELVPRLARTGVLVREEAEPGWFAVPPLVADYLAARPDGSTGGDASDQVARGAAWLERRGAHREALALLQSFGEHGAVADYVARHGHTLVAHGAAPLVLTAVDGLPPALRHAVVAPEVEARYAAGDWDGVLAALDRFDDGPLPPVVALRAGLALHLRGRIHDGIAVYDRGCPDDAGVDDADDALAETVDRAPVASILAYRAAARWLLGDGEACRADATAATALAQSCADDRALAASHTVAAMIAAVDGDRAANEAHYVRALAHAEAAGDVLQIIRIRTNRGSRALEEGAYAEGLAELDLAIDLAERSGYQAASALALSNRGEVHLRTGRVDEAARDLHAAVTRYVALGSRMRAYPLLHLGDLHLLRGERAQARAAYEEALDLAEEAADVQALVPALSGLAELLVDDDPHAAGRLVERALGLGPSLARSRALWVAGLVAVRRLDPDAPGSMIESIADELGGLARERRDRSAAAGAAELRALVAGPERALVLLEEAHELWRAIGEPVGQARVAIALAPLVDAPRAGRLLDEATEIVRRLGARSLTDAIDAAHRGLAQVDAAHVRIVTLGGFRVYRGAEPIAATEWQSRKARDLLKLLTTRLGRPVPRELVCETLWPDEPPERRSSRLSVTLSTLRSVLDPGRERDGDAFVAADRELVWLDLDAVDVDVVRFVAAARQAVGGPRMRAASGPPDRDELEALAAAESLYAGEYLDDEPYADWAVGLREEARALYLRVARRLAEGLWRSGELEHASHLFLRLLQRDPYDEAAHLGLVRVLDEAGHRGDARRAYRTYAERMADLDVEPASYPS
jgi:DNA-binding SARP family transcriptional activator/predicted negative regulator of RcsB-dependent stress response